MPKNHQPKKVIAHLIYRLDTGGLERVMVNCIQALQDSATQHVVICLTTSGLFAKELPSSVEVFALHKKPGADLSIHYKLLKLLRKIQADVLHTYNLATIEYHPVAWLAGVSLNIHAEHGRDIHDPQGTNRKYQFLRRLMSPFIDHFVSVSNDLHQWLINDVQISAKKCQLVYNGVDTQKFVASPCKSPVFTFVHVARLSPIKGQHFLLQAISLLLLRNLPPFQVDIIGDGPLRSELETYAQQLNLTAPQVNFLGDCQNVEQLMPKSHVFVLSSLAEGIPMTILEAMACGLPIIATNVGGVPEIIRDNGILVPASDAVKLADAMELYIRDHALAMQAGSKSLAIIDRSFSQQQMVNAYLQLYLAK